MEEVEKFKYLGSVLCRNGSTEREKRESPLQGRKMVGSLGHIMKETSVSMGAEEGLCDGIIIPTITYASETIILKANGIFRNQAVKTSYLRGACDVRRMNGESNLRVSNRFGMSSKCNGMECWVVEWVKRRTLTWFGHIERMTEINRDDMESV